MVAASLKTVLRQDGRQNFERTDHKFGSRNRHEHRHERSFEGKRERFEDRERSVNRRENDENHERRNSRFEARSDRRFDKNRQGYYQADGTARQDKKAYTRNFDRRDNDRNDTRFDKPTKNLAHKLTLIVQDATKHLVIRSNRQIQVLINLVVSLVQRQLKRSFCQATR